MATWLAHLRVAELISAELRAPWLSEPDFLAGNIAPDCGIPVPGGFDPPKEVTHWTQRGKGHCDYERFYREMIAGKSHDPHTLSFLLGYYCHLMADVLWVRRVNETCKELHRELYAADRAEYYRRVKPEWYANDHLYLREHPDCRVFREFCKIAASPTTAPTMLSGRYGIFSSSTLTRRNSAPISTSSRRRQCRNGSGAPRWTSPRRYPRCGFLSENI